jgi:RNA polymerase sigma-70 factor (ECF subfamily)
MKQAEIELLLTKIRNGNGLAITRLYHQMHTPLFLYINKHVHDVAVAEEVAQDTLLAVIEDIRSHQTVISFTGLLFGIARHKIADHFRRQKIKKILMSAVPEHVIDLCAGLFFSEHVEKSDIADQVERTLKRLPNEYAVIIRLKYIEGFPVQRIASLMSMSFKSAESMLFRARKSFTKLYTASA